MKGTLRKVFHMGLGAYELTRKKAEGILKDLEKEGKLSKSEAKKLVNEFLNEADKARARLQKEAAVEVKKALKSSVGQLKKHLDGLEKSLDKKPKKKSKPKKRVKKKPVKKAKKRKR